MTRPGGERPLRPTIGIDVSKGRLDAFRLSDGRRIQATNDKAGRRTLPGWIGRGDPPPVAFEAAGACPRQLEAALGAGRVPLVKANPRQARRFAEATGRLAKTLAKTDRIDAAMPARRGAVPDLAGQAAPGKALGALRDLAVARRAPIKDRVAAKTRLGVACLPLVRRRLAARLRQIAAQLAGIGAARAERVANDEEMARKRDILVSIPGIGETTALAMPAEMPELGTLGPKRAAGPAGLAPISRRSGTRQGRERIRGGRAPLRHAIHMPALVMPALVMPALVAARFNPALNATCEPLRKAGRPAKRAITAVMRKLVVLADALLCDNRKWTKTALSETRILRGCLKTRAGCPAGSFRIPR